MNEEKGIRMSSRKDSWIMINQVHTAKIMQSLI